MVLSEMEHRRYAHGCEANGAEQPSDGKRRREGREDGRERMEPSPATRDSQGGSLGVEGQQTKSKRSRRLGVLRGVGLRFCCTSSCRDRPYTSA